MHKSWFDAIRSKFPLKKVKAWASCLGMIRARIASQQLEKMTSRTVEPMETYCASPNKTRVLWLLLGTCARLHWCCLMFFFSLTLNINVLHLISRLMVVEPYTVVTCMILTLRNNILWERVNFSLKSLTFQWFYSWFNVSSQPCQRNSWVI